MGYGLFNFLKEVVVNRYSLGGYNGKLLVLKIDYVSRVFKNRRDIRGNEIACITYSYYKRTVLAHRDYLIGAVGSHDSKSVRALKALGRLMHGFKQILAVIEIINKLSHDFGICFRAERNALARKHFFEIKIILYYAVMHHRNIAGIAYMGVRIDV